MRVIRKYKLFFRKDIYMPAGAVILKLIQAGQFGQPILIYVEIDDEAPIIPRRFDIFSTNTVVPSDAKYIDTYSIAEHTWHVYEVSC